MTKPATPCPSCEGRRMVTRGHLDDGRPRWVVCPKCLGAGPVTPPCYEPPTGLKSETVNALLAIQNETTGRRGSRLWSAIPVHIQGVLDRYFKRHIHPGGTMFALLCGDVEEARAQADTPTKQAMLAIIAWLYESAPAQSWGDEELVLRWLECRPPAMTVAEIEHGDGAITEDGEEPLFV